MFLYFVLFTCLLIYSYYYSYYYCCYTIIIIVVIIIIMYWASSWSREVFQPKMPYYVEIDTCPMKNSGMTLTFMWNLELLCIHNLPYTIPLVGYGQGVVHSTCLTWDFLNTYHMFFHEAIRVCTTQATN